MNGNNCCVLGDGNSAGDHGHVTRMTPLDIKKKELMQAKTETEAQEKEQMVQAGKMREVGDARPLGGVK